MPWNLPRPLFHQHLRAALLLGCALGSACKEQPSLVARTCYPNGICLEPDGSQVTADGSPIASLTGLQPNVATDPNVAPLAFLPPPLAAPKCHCDVIPGVDNDGDCLSNADELAYLSSGNSPGFADKSRSACAPEARWGSQPDEPGSNPNNADTDCDGIADGCENWHDTRLYDAPFETSPLDADSDRDGLLDGVEDLNHNGIRDGDETSATAADTDADGIADGAEDRNHNGLVDAYIDTNGNACFDANDTPGETNPRSADSDGDLLLDGIEDRNHNGVFDADPDARETVGFAGDSDCDGIPDGLEDTNRNGLVDVGETDPRNIDSDGDGIADGVEDKNHNGRYEAPTETSPILVDTDGDGIADGLEDSNHNGRVESFIDINKNGCFDFSVDKAGESDPRKIDTDGDGINDGVEDANADGLCGVQAVPDPISAQRSAAMFSETCAFVADTDCDGLKDGIEDKNHNGARDGDETDPRRADTDFDGLADGCVAGATPNACEDFNNNGVQDVGETSAIFGDSDGDGLPDGCERRFGPHPPNGGTNPLAMDTDADGYSDAQEDVNRNCQTDGGESDPRIANPSPMEATSAHAQWSVCAPANLIDLTFAQDSRTTGDYKVAFEVERATTQACSSGSDADCPSGQKCMQQACRLQAPYTLVAFGKDNNANGFSADDPGDTLHGWLFESPPGVQIDPLTGDLINRDIYGFVRSTSDGRTLDDILDGLRGGLSSGIAGATGTEVTNLPARPAYDSLPANANVNFAGFPINFAQRQIAITTAAPTTAIALRNNLLLGMFLGGKMPDPVLPQADAVYGNMAACSLGMPHCYTAFSLSIGAVQRLKQTGPDGSPVVIFVVALTPDDSGSQNPLAAKRRAYEARLSRLEDLTGGSAVGRFAASVAGKCESLAQQTAKADMLWVVDDSRSMQQMIGRLQQAAKDAEAVLKSNASIVDFRVAMTTTNPAAGARTLCKDYCDSSCQGNTANDAALCAGSNGTSNQCADQTLGCIKACPASCTYVNASCTAGSCACSSCPGTLSGQGGPYADDCTNSCTSPVYLSEAIAQDALTYHLPGGGGTFYFEDTQYLDCDSSSGLGQVPFLNVCNTTALRNSSLQKFFGPPPTLAHRALADNGGFLHSRDPNLAACSTAKLDLSYKTGSAYTPCGDANHPCCDRLVDACDDGPTVLASQMCDLIRAMGGVPAKVAGGITSSARRHSAAEMGTRSARRLLGAMLPAWPLDRSDPASPAYTPAAKGHLRMSCKSTDPNCPTTCDPTTAKCPLVPLATVFLSDEEDFYFKDDCAFDAGGQSPIKAQSYADRQQLPSGCRYIDGDPNTIEPCTTSYCAAFAAQTPQGYNPDQTNMSSDASFSLQWRDAAAPQCAASAAATSCIGDPCPTLSSANCAANPQCVFNPMYDDNSGTISGCINRCAVHVAKLNPSAAQAQAQQNACTADPACRWDASQVLPGLQDPFTSPPGPCVAKFASNDCQACKRFLRTQDALQGAGSLPGFAKMGGPVYAIVRNKGKPGSGNFDGTSSDSCAGGPVTWGHGDGQAYRDLAQSTLGRTQDVCAPSFQDFMQQVTADLAVLSTPYPLVGRPIASTLQVSLARPLGQQRWATIVVPRSRTQGFFYSATGNTLGFKSDPIDGLCAPGAGCQIDGTIDGAEALYARTLATVPQPGDIIYVSYRLWTPVPCGGMCQSDETCAQLVCQPQLGSFSCRSLDSSLCPAGYTCQADDSCKLACQAGQLFDTCVRLGSCGACETYNTVTRQCDRALGCCNPTGQKSCLPDGPNTCGRGLACDDTCVCVQNPTCPASEARFFPNGNVSACAGALACCDRFARDAATCTSLSTAAACTANANCRWPGSCSAAVIGAPAQCANLSQRQCQAASPTCAWTPKSAATCQYRYGLCCPAGAPAARCTTDVETGISRVYCPPSSCDCHSITCPQGQDCDPLNACTSDTDCAACACHPNAG